MRHIFCDSATDILSFKVIDIYIALGFVLVLVFARVPAACLLVPAAKLDSDVSHRYSNIRELSDSALPSEAIPLLLTADPSVIDCVGCWSRMVARSFPSFSFGLWQMLAFSSWIFVVDRRG
jgi:hypothetical protein